jgi:hypothetical protein
MSLAAASLRPAAATTSWHHLPMARRRTTLPKDFADLLRSSSLDELVAVFDRCEVEATGGYTKSTALGFLDCPDGLVRWLVDQGADVDAVDTYGATPLWTRAARGRHEQIPLLLSLGADRDHTCRGGVTPLHAAAENQRDSTVEALIRARADVHATTDRGDTPLKRGLASTTNASIAAMAHVARLLLEAGAVVDDSMRALVERIGERFEFHRAGFNADFLPETDAGLQELYRLFGASPAPQRVVHDGVAPIEVPAGTWQAQHAALWELLVPSKGAAQTAQGEAIRITGRVHDEVFRNGGGNWDRDYRRMLDVLVELCGSGTPLGARDLDELGALTHRFERGSAPDEVLDRLDELAVLWVAQNPTPIPCPPVPYKR